MKKPDGARKVLLIDHTEGQCRAIVGFKDEDEREAYMCGEPVLRKPGKKISSWCAYHYGQMHSTSVEQPSARNEASGSPALEGPSPKRL